jgi:hypothetical protein
LLEYFDNDAPSTELRVTFQKCLFEQNYFTGEPGQAALVVGNSQQNRLVFEQCLFNSNDMIVNNRDVSAVVIHGMFDLCCMSFCMLPLNASYLTTTACFFVFSVDSGEKIVFWWNPVAPCR